MIFPKKIRSLLPKEGGMDPGHSKTMSTKAGLFNFSERTGLLGILLRCRFCFRRSGVGPKSLHFWQAPPSSCSCSPGMAGTCSSGEGPDAPHTCPNRQRAAREGRRDADGTSRPPPSFLHPRPSCASRIAPHHDPPRPSFLSLFCRQDNRGSSKFCHSPKSHLWQGVGLGPSYLSL